MYQLQQLACFPILAHYQLCTLQPEVINSVDVCNDSLRQIYRYERALTENYDSKPASSEIYNTVLGVTSLMGLLVYLVTLAKTVCRICFLKEKMAK